MDEEQREQLTFAQLHARDGPPTTPVSARVPDPLLEELDRVWEERGFESRSAFVRAVLEAVAEDPESADAVLGEREEGTPDAHGWKRP